MKKTHYIIPFLIGLALAIGIFIGGKLQFGTNSQFFTSNSVNSNNLNKAKLNKLIDYINYEYVDDVNTDSIVDLTVNQILGKLDPHSQYISKDNVSKIHESMSGQFVGIGIQFYIYKDSLTIIKTIDGSDARTKNLRFGDRILAADTVSFLNKDINDKFLKDNLRGIENSSVKLTVYRKTTDSLFTINVIRKQIPIKSVENYYVINNTFGYLKINRFAQNTQQEFEKAIRELKSHNIEKLILDLRNNPGGYMHAGIQIADEFLENQKLIVFTKNKNGDIQNTYATSEGEFENKPVFVLVNESTASAAEIVAGALQDNDQGTIVGRRTFGKGLVQSEMPLPDGSVIRLTTSRYYTPTGRSIQRPYVMGEREKYEDDYHKRLNYKKLSSTDSTQVNDTLKFITPKGKTVYGGGGITPDIEVIMSESEDFYWTKKILDSALTLYFIFEYLDENPEKLPQLTKDAFISQYTISAEMVKAYYKFIDKKGFDIKNNQKLIKKYLKAGVAEILFNGNLAAKIRNEGDPFIERCTEKENK